MRPSKPIMFAMMSIFVWTWLVGLFAPSVMADDALGRFERAGLGLFRSRALLGSKTLVELSQT